MLVGFFLSSIGAWAFDTLRIDLKPHFQSYSDNTGFHPYEGNARIAYLSIQQCSSDAIEVRSKEPFSIFLNQRLTHRQVRFVKISRVELTHSIGEAGMLAIMTKNGVANLQCEGVSAVQENLFTPKPTATFGFIIVMGILLMSGIIALVRTNPAMTFEYFNMVKTFSLKRSDDVNLTVRLASLTNLFFFLLCSVAGGVLLFLFQKGKAIASIDFTNTAHDVGLLVVYIFIILITKGVWLRFFAALFDQRNFGLSQYYDYIKVLLMSFIFSLLILLLLVMLGVDWSSWINPLQYFIVIISVVFTVLIFLKLLGQGGFTVFHLFSYLCATELIPLIILLNIFFK